MFGPFMTFLPFPPSIMRQSDLLQFSLQRSTVYHYYRTNSSVHNVCEDAKTDGCFKADCKPEHEMELVDMIDSEIPGQ